MTLVKVVDVPPLDIQRAIVQSTWNLCKEEATYTMTFGGKTPREITEISAVGARELYVQSARREFAYSFMPLQLKDQVVGDIWIVDAVWQATDPETGATWTFTTRGAEHYDPRGDSFAVANRKAWGKAERNASLRCVPYPIRKAFLGHLTGALGKPVVETAEEGEPLPEGASAAPAASPPSGGNLATPKQKGYLRSLGKQLGWESQEEVEEVLGTAIDALTSKQASRAIEDWQAQINSANRMPNL